MIDLKHEIERELSLIDPPDLWDRIQAEASNDGDPLVLDLTTARHRRRPSPWLAVAAAAACLVVVALATVVMSDRQSVDATDPSESPASQTPTTACDQDNQVVVCDDGATTDEGEEPILLPNRMRFIDGPLADGTLHLDVHGEDDLATGTLRFDQIRDRMIITVDCVDTDTETATARFIVLGGEVTTPPDDGTSVAGDRLFLIIRRNPSSSVMLAEGDAAGSCSEFLDSAPGDLLTDESNWSEVGDGSGAEETLATGHDVAIGGFGDLAGQTLNIDAHEEDGEVTGEFRVNNVVVTLQCADTDTIDGEIRLGGEVTADPDGQGLAVIDDAVAVGDRVALIVRERGPDFDMVSLYANDTAGSCTELVESVPYNLDGGFFNDIADGDAIQTGGVNFNP